MGSPFLLLPTPDLRLPCSLVFPICSLMTSIIIPYLILLLSLACEVSLAYAVKYFISCMQVLISGQTGDWHETLNNHEADLEWHLVKRFNMHVAIDICIKDDALLPRLKVIVEKSMPIT